jgi:hypothetical protein
MSDEITFKMQMVTAEKAAAWLQRNNGNRKISRTDVLRLKEVLQKGEWRLVHQAIAFDSSGNLIDGQHRLTAIAESGIPAPLYVAQYATLATARGMPFDIGRKRTIAQVLQQDAKATQIINTLHNMLHGNGSQISLTVMNATIERHAATLDKLIDVTRKAAKSPATVRAGAFLAILDTEQHGLLTVDDILKQVWAFVHSEYDLMWSSVRCLNRQWENGTINGATNARGQESSDQRTARSYIAFTPANIAAQVIRCVEPRTVIREAVARIGKDNIFTEINQ